MKRLLLIWLLFPVWASAQLSPEQEAQVDSLKHVITASEHDTVIINAWVAWDNIIFASDPDLDYQLNRRIDSLCSSNLTREMDGDERINF